MKKTDPEFIDLAATYACILASTEVGLGSLLHGFHIPLSGQVLSLNQVFLLAHSMALVRRTRGAMFLPSGISSLAATLKSLSPAGKKLTPMLAIAMQGCLFNLGTLLLGNTIAGRGLGAILSSVWAFVQPLVFVGLVFGLEWQKLYGALAPYVPFSNVAAVLAAVVLAKALAACALSLMALYLPQQAVAAYFTKLNALGAGRKSPVQEPERSSLRAPRANRANRANAIFMLGKGLQRPLFIIPFAATLAAAYLVEGSGVALVWAGLRPIALACVVFVVVRLLSQTVLGEKLAALLPTRYRQALQVAWERFSLR